MMGVDDEVTREDRKYFFPTFKLAVERVVRTKTYEKIKLMSRRIKTTT